MMRLKLLCQIAATIDEQHFTPITLNDTGEVRLEAIFNPDSVLAGHEIVRNPVSFNDSHVVALTSPNGSGKTFYQESVTNAVLLGQTLGYAPASYATMPVFANISLIHRVAEKNDKFSSFAQDAQNWKTYLEMLELIDGPTLLTIDEPFTTTSETYQAAFTFAMIAAIRKQGNHYISVATHNHAAVRALGPMIVPYHFSFEIDDQKRLNRYFVLEPGYAPSHAAEMARTLGFPEEILRPL